MGLRAEQSLYWPGFWPDLRRGPNIKAKVVEDMMENYGFHHRISSVANPHANARAELGLKTVKRMLIDIVSEKGLLDRAVVLTSASVEKHSGKRQQAVSSQGSL
jgi:hypothetical protein